MSAYLTKGHFATPVDKTAVAEEWRGRGYSCHDFFDSPGQVWPDFVHRTQELVTVVEGRLELELGGETVVAEAGDEVFIPKETRHTVRNINTANIHWLFGYD